MLTSRTCTRFHRQIKSKFSLKTLGSETVFGMSISSILHGAFNIALLPKFSGGLSASILKPQHLNHLPISPQCLVSPDHHDSLMPFQKLLIVRHHNAQVLLILKHLHQLLVIRCPDIHASIKLCNWKSGSFQSLAGSVADMELGVLDNVLLDDFDGEPDFWVFELPAVKWSVLCLTLKGS